MKKEPTYEKFKLEVFLIASGLISFVTLLSWVFAFAKDEGQIDEKDEPIKNFIADTFYFFRLPTHQLFEPWILTEGIILYFPGLMINTIVWALLTERLISIGTRLFKQKRAESNVR